MYNLNNNICMLQLAVEFISIWSSISSSIIWNSYNKSS